MQNEKTEMQPSPFPQYRKKMVLNRIKLMKVSKKNTFLTPNS